MDLCRYCKGDEVLTPVYSTGHGTFQTYIYLRV